jgi:hypothetical protein
LLWSSPGRSRCWFPGCRCAPGLLRRPRPQRYGFLFLFQPLLIDSRSLSVPVLIPVIEIVNVAGAWLNLTLLALQPYENQVLAGG